MIGSGINYIINNGRICGNTILERKAVRKSGRAFVAAGLLDGAPSCSNAPAGRAGDDT